MCSAHNHASQHNEHTITRTCKHKCKHAPLAYAICCMHSKCTLHIAHDAGSMLSFQSSFPKLQMWLALSQTRTPFFTLWKNIFLWYERDDKAVVIWTWQLVNWTKPGHFKLIFLKRVMVGQLFRIVKIYVLKRWAVHHLCVTKPLPPSGHSPAHHITLQYRKLTILLCSTET